MIVEMEINGVQMHGYKENKSYRLESIIKQLSK